MGIQQLCNSRCHNSDLQVKNKVLIYWKMQFCYYSDLQVKNKVLIYWKIQFCYYSDLQVKNKALIYWKMQFCYYSDLQVKNMVLIYWKMPWPGYKIITWRTLNTIICYRDCLKYFKFAWLMMTLVSNILVTVSL